MKPSKLYLYSDELNEEFSGISRNTIVIDDKYNYVHNGLGWKIGSFICYRVIMTPVAFFYMKLKFHMKIENRKVLKQCKKEGYFLYGNHTLVPGDGYIPTVMTFPKKDSVLVNADNVSLKGTKTFMEMIGAYPIPTNIKGMKNFMKGLKNNVMCNRSIVIYPEAHIWPYYTKIRPFTSESFAYPIMFKKPVYCFTVTYQKRKYIDKPAITVYVDGPFHSDKTIKAKLAQEKLRDEIYDTMVKRSKNSTYECARYVKRRTEMEE